MILRMYHPRVRARARGVQTGPQAGMRPEWDVIGNPLSYGLYLRPAQEHITPVEHIPP